MVVTLKRKRGAVSYREPSSDDDSSDSSEQEDRMHSRRPVPSRRSTRHHEPSARPTPPLAAKREGTQPRAPRRRERPKISYKDVSTDDEDGEEDPDADFEASEDEPAPRATKSRTSAQPPKAPSHKAQHKATSKGRSPRNRTLGAPLKTRDPSRHVPVATAIPTDGHKPSWGLPYHVLLQIFVYASHPLRDENMRPMASIPWLVQIAQMCTTFTKPALTALYRNPPIFAIKQKRKELVNHLISPPKQALEDPRVMVKRLELDVTQMSALTDPSHSIMDLVSLIKSLTTLRELDIFDPFDRPPFRERIRRIRRWVYPPQLFETLQHSEVRLQSWRWNSTFCAQGPLWMQSVHSDAAFQSLRELTLTKFHPAEMRDAEAEDDETHRQPTKEELIASALAPLLHLRSLSFETCGIVSGQFLPLLPTNLVSLSITNCGELLSDALQAFLATHGAHIEDLTLNHNQSLDLSFMVDLKSSCPRLEFLRMDTTYYSSLAMSSDNEPLYETLLGETDRPTWPSTLRVIDMEYLRNWNSAAATNFFSSLIDAADELPWLRELTIIAMVDTDWRQRAEFRRKWTELFQKVFARKWTMPSAHLASMKAFREWKAGVVEADEQPDKNDSLLEGVPEVAEMKLDDSDSDSDVPLIPSRRQGQDEKWGSTRLRSRSKAAASYDDASSDNADSEKESTRDEEIAFVQGRCHTVLFRIDNFRPREEIYGEADFLDTEPSGDEEWNGNDDQNEDEGGYAW